MYLSVCLPISVSLSSSLSIAFSAGCSVFLWCVVVLPFSLLFPLYVQRRSERQAASGGPKSKSPATALDPASDSSRQGQGEARQEDAVLHADGRATSEDTSGEYVVNDDSIEGDHDKTGDAGDRDWDMDVEAGEIRR